MSETQAIGVVSLFGALILFGASALRWRRAGAPVGRYALIWLAVFALAFAFSTFVAGR